MNAKIVHNPYANEWIVIADPSGGQGSYVAGRYASYHEASTAVILRAIDRLEAITRAG